MDKLMITYREPTVHLYPASQQVSRMVCGKLKEWLIYYVITILWRCWSAAKQMSIHLALRLPWILQFLNWLPRRWLCWPSVISSVHHMTFQVIVLISIIIIMSSLRKRQVNLFVSFSLGSNFRVSYLVDKVKYWTFPLVALDVAHKVECLFSLLFEVFGF